MIEPMVIPTPWGAVGGGVRVRLSTGRIVNVLDRIPGRPDLVLLRSASGETRLATVDPRATADVLFGQVDAAVAILRRRFTKIEFLRGER